MRASSGIYCDVMRLRHERVERGDRTPPDTDPSRFPAFPLSPLTTVGVAQAYADNVNCALLSLHTRTGERL